MRIPLLPLVLASLIALASSCQTPLAPTTYPIQSVPGLEGQWTMVLEGVDEEEWPLNFELTDPEESSGLRQILNLDPLPQETRYHAEAHFPEDAFAMPEMGFDCQVVSASGRQYLTFQRTPEEGESAYFYLFEVPLQNTLRMELDGDELRLLMHKERYLWVPMALSGELKVGKPGEVAGVFGALVPSLDAVLEAYAGTRDDDWTVLCRGKRAGG